MAAIAVAERPDLTTEAEPSARPGRASVQVYARVAGLMYLLVALLAPFAEFFVRKGLIVPGDPAATAANVVASESLFRAGFASDLAVFVMEVALAAVLFVLFRPVSRPLALVMAFARLAMATVLGFNLLHMLTGLQLLIDVCRKADLSNALDVPRRRSEANAVEHVNDGFVVC